MEKKEKKNYIEPVLEVIVLNVGEVITSSVENPFETEDDIF